MCFLAHAWTLLVNTCNTLTGHTHVHTLHTHVHTHTLNTHTHTHTHTHTFGTHLHTHTHTPHNSYVHRIYIDGLKRQCPVGAPGGRILFSGHPYRHCRASLINPMYIAITGSFLYKGPNVEKTHYNYVFSKSYVHIL